MSKRFQVQERERHGEYYHALVDTATGNDVGYDGGEPEDQTLTRDWAWVVRALNAVDDERKALLGETGGDE